MQSASRPHDGLAVNSTPELGYASLRDRTVAIAELGVRALGAERCTIAVQVGRSGDVVIASSGDAKWDAVVNALLGALANPLGDQHQKPNDSSGATDSLGTIALSPHDIDAIARVGRMNSRGTIAASAFTDGASTVRIAIVAPELRSQTEVESSLELIARAALNAAALSAARASLEFWRNQGAEKGRHAVDVERELTRTRDSESRHTEAVAEARRARPADRLGRFGELVAGGGGYDQWIVAVSYSGALKVVASSPGLNEIDVTRPGSALAQCFNRRVVIKRPRERDAIASDEGRKYSEDKILAGSYVCIPFEAGAIALASSDMRASQADAEAIVERLAPLVSTWQIEQELTRRDALVRRLALRMFAAIDEERARIARDLHDDQAQLIAAVKIALEGRQDEARPIFEQVEQELRRKTRELRPAMLRDASLNEAIEAEFAQMNRAGIKAKLFHGGPVEKISRPVEQLCFQVVREALSNVIRHARAKSVEVTIEKIDGTARISIVDDGRGIADNKNEGIGMVGMRERLELMGGSMKVKSKAGGTTVIAEIPELS